MPGNEEFMRFMAAWALVHETADEGWKAAVERGSGQAVGEMESGPEAFVDGLSAMIAQEKERLKAELASGQIAAPGSQPELGEILSEMRFEIGELRGRMESMQASLDSLSKPERG